MMSAPQTPDFVRDYDLTEAELRAIPGGDNEEQKAWVVARLLEAARFEDIWRYISLREFRAIFPKLQLKPKVRADYEFALRAWAAEPGHDH